MPDTARATAPCCTGPLYHHIGLYSWRRDTLEVEEVLLGMNTPSDLQRAREILRDRIAAPGLVSAVSGK